MAQKIKVSIIIKALNEEKNIDRAIESSLEASASFASEVIIADSGSTDRTVERAMKFPVTIVQLARPEERCCGISPQLGYQHSSGEYIYILDGDMKLDAAFLARAIEFLDREPSCAGVGGQINDMQIENLEFLARAKRNRQRSKQAINVATLNGGGLYRRKAVDQVGYLSDRNLHGYEEFDLGARLRVKGWQLVRLEVHAADHYGYTMKTFQLLWHRIRGGYPLGTGEILRAALENHYARNIISELRVVSISAGVWAYWALVILICFGIPRIGWAIMFFLFMSLLLPMAMTLRTRSLLHGFYSVLIWHVNAIALVVGFVRKRISPMAPVESRTLCTPGNSNRSLT